MNTHGQPYSKRSRHRSRTQVRNCNDRGRAKAAFYVATGAARCDRRRRSGPPKLLRIASYEESEAMFCVFILGKGGTGTGYSTSKTTNR
ncbi:hypothetical protein EVAR_69832_1 [Eumeta japonica]|uniref:Uncharacterized protein n=1 Tax=Eumeta variegata TaxID=151549 RepID=A0A4C2A0K9_EUMVA|nr:hypothetical protein EVAR_69832_1 [Eumeta japonica]